MDKTLLVALTAPSGFSLMLLLWVYFVHPFASLLSSSLSALQKGDAPQKHLQTCSFLADLLSS